MKKKIKQKKTPVPTKVKGKIKKRTFETNCTKYIHSWDKIAWDESTSSRIRRWTNNLNESDQIKLQVDDPRPVSVGISSWVGTSVGAKHFTLIITEHDQMYWSDEENCWCEVSKDSTKMGFSAKLECYSEQQAKTLATMIINEVFGKPTTKRRKMWRISKDF